MWSSPYLWIFVAVWVFWSLGAYNRLVRLKAAADAAAAQWQTLQRRCTALAREWVTAQRDATQPQHAQEMPGADEAHGVHALHHAAPPVAEGADTMVSPDAAHSAEPNDGPADALRAASEVLEAVLEKPQALLGAQARLAEAQQASALLQDAWGRTMQDRKDAEGAMGAKGTDVDMAQWQARWAELQGLLAPAQKAYEDAAQSYCSAIAQFPASVLARTVGFKPV
jgi:LemA protein